MSSVKTFIAFTAGLVAGATAVTLVLTDKGDKLVEKIKKGIDYIDKKIDAEEDGNESSE